MLFFLPVAVDGYVLTRVTVLFVGVALGVALCFFRPRGSLLELFDPLPVPALALAAAALGAMAVSVSPWVSLAGQYLRYESAPVRLAYLALFGVTACLLAAAGVGARRLAVTAFLLACSVVALEAAWESIANLYGLAGALARPDGNLGNAALLGVVEAMAVPLALGRLLEKRAVRWAPVLLLVLLGLLLSSERSAWLGALLAVTLVFAARLPRARLVWAVPAALLLAAVALALVAGPLGALNADPYTLRLQLWQRVLPMIQARPLLGWGEDTFGLAFGGYAQGYLPHVLFDRAHSQPLDLAAAQGLLGLAASALFWVLFALAILRSGRWRREEGTALMAALAAYTAWSLVNFDWVPATALFWLLAGVAWATGREAGPPRRADRRLASLVTLLAAGAAAIFGILPLAADLAAYRSLNATAVALDPIQAHYHQLLGEDYLGQGRLAPAAGELRLATELGDDDPLAWWHLGDAEQRLGDTAAAAAARARARQIDPTVGE